ncbi:MAG TPA: hypothetical protein VNB29_07025 [Chthoniobacterales bacterium]|nr:hypothetical protein [Chthoniobacterales bacterium]
MINHADLMITERFASGKTTVDELIAPLIEQATDSASLVVGYGINQPGDRSQMIPYFHVCGTSSDHPPVRALLVGGWVGTETVTPYALARLIAALEAVSPLAAGTEVTAYPVANLAAHREGVFVTPDQAGGQAVCWEESAVNHVRVLEKELRRYDYDFVILLRQNPRALSADVEAWLPTKPHKIVFSEALDRYAAADADFKWRANPSAPVYARHFTPIPGTTRQPVEITIGLAAAKPPAEQANEAISLVLSLLHAVRHARSEGVL